MRNVLLIEPNAPEAILWSRGEEGEWTYTIFEGLDTVVSVPSVDLELKLADIYADLDLRPVPKLVEGDRS